MRIQMAQRSAERQKQLAQSHPHLPATDTFATEPAALELHHAISHSRNCPLDVYAFVNGKKDDPATKVLLVYLSSSLQ